jgi:hypothetical protein
VHADRRPGAVPALGQEHRVDQHVDLPGLVFGQDPGQVTLGRLARDGLGVDAHLAEGLGHVVGVLDAGRVNDPRDAVEAGLVQIGDGHVERRLVQQLGQHLLVKFGVHLTSAQRHLGDRPHSRAWRDPDAPQRRDHSTPGRLRQVKARGLGGEQVGDVTGDQRARRRHADEDRSGPAPNRGRCLFAQGGVGLVADHDRVRVGDPPGVAHEPLIGLHRDRPVGGIVITQEWSVNAIAIPPVA